MKIVALKDVKRTDVDMEGVSGVTKQLPIGSGDGSPSFSFRVFTVEPGGNTPHHTHPFEHLNYIISGTGAVVDEAGTETQVAAGDFGLVTPGEKHQYKNTSDTEDLVFLCAVPKEYE